MTTFHSLENGFKIDNRYVIVKLIGGGRNSAVYETLDLKSNSTVAVKVLDPFLAQDSVNVERFAREAQILRHIDHPNVIKVFDLVNRDELKCIVMEYFPARNMSDYLKANGTYKLEAFIAIATSLIKVIKTCHDRLVIHRDIKPQNILIADDGTVKLVDFGISRMSAMSDLTKTGTALGTPEYMAPEAFQTSHTDGRADIYALGAMFYELLTGTPPYAAQSLHQIMKRQIAGDFKRVSELREDIPQWVDDLIAKCLLVNPADRYQNCGDLLHDLQVKGSAIARFEKNRDAGKCLHCSNAMMARVPFCLSCGKFRAEIFGTGSTCVVLHQAEKPAEIAEYLKKSFPDFSLRMAEKRLHKLPALVLNNVNKSTAEIVLNDLYRFPVQVQLADNLPQELKLSLIYYVVAVLGLLPAFVLQDISILGRGVIVALTELSIYSLFSWRMRPLINLKHLKSRNQQVPAILTKFAHDLPEVIDSRLRSLLGTVAASYLNLRDDVNNPTQLDTAMEQCLEFTQRLNLTSIYLRDQSVAEIKKRLDDVTMRIKHSKDTASTEALIQFKAQLLSEYDSYRKVQVQYADSVSILLNFCEVLSTAKREKGSSYNDFQWEAEAQIKTQEAA